MEHSTSDKGFTNILALKKQCNNKECADTVNERDYSRDGTENISSLLSQSQSEYLIVNEEINGGADDDDDDDDVDDDCIGSNVYSNEITSIKDLNELEFREQKADITSSVSFLGKRITRQYASEFILPDDTRIGVHRREFINPVDNMEQVLLSLSVGYREYPLWRKACNSSNSGQTYDQPKQLQAIQHGLQIVDYLHDDLWAETILTCDNSTNLDLLRQLEIGCRMEPDAYRMERVQTVKNRETVIDVHNQPVVRTIGVSKSASEAESITTMTTSLDIGNE